MPIVLDHSHSDEIVLVLWCIDDRSAIGMVPDLVKTDPSVADAADSVLCRSNIGQQTCIAEDANVRMVVKGVVVETLGLELFPLMQDLSDMITGSDPGLGGVLSGSSVSGTVSTAGAFSS